MYRYLIVALVLAGCTMSPSNFIQPADLYHPTEHPFTYDAFYADLFWRCTTPQGGGVRVEGYAVSSIRSNMALFDFQVRLIARDAKDNILADRWTYGDRLTASNIEPVPFAISLPVAGDGVRYDLYYTFEVPDGAGQARGGYRIHGVRLVVTGAGMEIFGTIEDVCGARWREKAVTPSS
ncbi:MAG: hypothetical protein ACE5KI_05310 [Dehalococcoidia bacterium]